MQVAEMDPESKLHERFETFFECHPEMRRFADVIILPPTIGEVVAEYPDAADDSELCERGMEMVKDWLSRFGLYVISRRQGNSHRFAVTVAMQKYPMGMTDDVFWGGRPHFADVYGEEYFHQVKSLLAQRGVTLNSQDEYLPELAQYKGDPKAVVTRSQGRAYIRRRCEELGVACHGAVEVESRPPEQDPFTSGVPLGEDLIAAEATRYVRDVPGADKMSRGELRAAILKNHGPSE